MSRPQGPIGSRAVAFDPQDPELQEELARASYYRERYDDMIADQEHVAEAEYYCLRWEQLASGTQRPYRVAVSTTLKHVAELTGVA